jgi:hypothetical protein
MHRSEIKELIECATFLAWELIAIVCVGLLAFVFLTCIVYAEGEETPSAPVRNPHRVSVPAPAPGLSMGLTLGHYKANGCRDE